MNRRHILSEDEASRGDAEETSAERFARARHARYLERGVVYHVISRTRGNLFLLRPDLAGKLRATIAGVLAEAKSNWPSIANYASTALSNHLHAILAATSGDPRDLVDYIAFVKREISRRWKSTVGWCGSLWEGYHCTAVITPKAQVRALRYVLSQSVKEGIVEDPRAWPGFHCAQSLTTGEPIRGIWFDGTGYGKALHAERAKKEENRKEIRREDYAHERVFAFDPLPALADLSPEEYRKAMASLVDEIVEAGRNERRLSGAKVLGARAVCHQEPLTSRPVPLPEWFEERRRMVVWDDIRDQEVRAYLSRYWVHQTQFRMAADHWRRCDLVTGTAFPELCFIPGRRPPPIAA